MTFDLMRFGWPNTVAILALAIMPVIALTATPNRHSAIAQMERTEAATICQMTECPILAAANVAPEFVFE